MNFPFIKRVSCLNRHNKKIFNLRIPGFVKSLGLILSSFLSNGIKYLLQRYILSKLEGQTTPSIYISKDKHPSNNDRIENWYFHLQIFILNKHIYSNSLKPNEKICFRSLTSILGHLFLFVPKNQSCKRYFVLYLNFQQKIIILR